MAINKATTQGQKFSWDTESALGTAAGAPVDFRPEAFEFPTNAQDTYVPMSGGHTNPADKNLVIPYKGGEGTGTIDMLVRRATTTLTPSVIQLLQAGGWTIAKISDQGACDTGCTTSKLITKADEDQEDAYMVNVETTADRFEPMQIATWTVGTLTAVPLFKLSAAPSEDEIVEIMHMAYPQSGPLGSTETLTFTELSRVEDGSDHPQVWTHGGCACVLKTITITPNEPLKFSYDVLIANTDVADDTWSVETDHEVVGVAMANNDFEFLMAQGDCGSGDLTRTAVGIRSIVIETGVSIKKVTSIGADTDVNSVGGYVAVLEQPTWTVEGWFDIAKFDDYKTEFVSGSGTNPDTALAASFSSQDYLLYPSVLITMPRANLIEAPTAKLNDTDSGMVEGTLKFGGNGAAFNSGDGPTSAADQAIYIGVSGSAP